MSRAGSATTPPRLGAPELGFRVAERKGAGAWRGYLWRAACLCGFILGASGGCSASPTPSPNDDPRGVIFVAAGEKIQTGPPTEELKVAFSDAIVLAENNGEDLGYPWFDVTTGEFVLSTVTQRGRDLIAAAAIATPYRVRSVAHGTTELRRILDDATSLREQGVPDAELIYSTVPDWRDNRALIVISASSEQLVDALIARYPADALAVQVKPPGAP